MPDRFGAAGHAESAMAFRQENQLREKELLEHLVAHRANFVLEQADATLRVASVLV